MTSQEFRALCNRVFTEYGFVKKGKGYYLDLGSDILGSIHFQASNYGKAFYLNCGFSLKNANEHMPYPKYTETNMDQRIAVPGKEKLANKPEDYEYLAEIIKYELYNQNEMEEFLKKDLDSWVIPAIKNGMSFILSHEDMYRVMLNWARFLHKIPE